MKIKANEYPANDIIKFIRERENLTQAELAKRAKISKSSIEKYEYGTVNYSFATFLKIANACNLEIIIPTKNK